MSIPYDEIKQLIAEHTDVAEFADFGEGVSVECIDKAENELGKVLPDSYRWWLKNYGGGEIGGEEIFSIYEEDFDSVVGGDIVYMDRINRKNNLIKPNHLCICESDTDGLFVLDYNQVGSDDEPCVFSLVTGKIYADNFLEFLKKRINAFTE